MPSATRRTELIWFERATYTTNDNNEQIPTWANYATRRARVRFGSAEEKRNAAQEGGIQTATFECVRSNTLLQVNLKDRIIYLSTLWDIVAYEVLDTKTIRFTATRTL